MGIIRDKGVHRAFRIFTISPKEFEGIRGYWLTAWGGGGVWVTHRWIIKENPLPGRDYFVHYRDGTKTTEPKQEWEDAMVFIPMVGWQCKDDRLPLWRRITLWLTWTSSYD